MRKFMRFEPRILRFRWLLLLGSAFALLAVFAPRANADCPACLRYYNFEGQATAPYPVNLDSHAPALEVGAAFRAFLNTGTDPTLAAAGIYPAASTSAEPGLPVNVAIGDPGPNLTSLGIHRSGANQLYIDVPFFSATGVYDITSVSFAIAANGNGYEFVSLLISSNGGATFTQIGATQAIPNGPGSILSFTIPSGTTLNDPMTVLRLAFTGGRSNGVDLQNQIDNIQINGTAVPEPATVAGGLLGILGLCWHQRRRLRSLLPRRA
jgi:hypothetical protein